MAEIVKMPKLSDTMTEGVVAEWHKKVGEEVEAGELLAEIETDKATMEFESFQDGVLLHIGVEKGATAPVDSILAILGTKGEDISELLAKGNESLNQEVKEEKVEASTPETPSVSSKTTPAQEPAPVAQRTSADGRIKASPLAKRLADEKGIDISILSGSGDNGRIVKRDIENYQPSTSNASYAVSGEPYRDEKVSQMRKTIARRLAESKFQAPHFYLTMEIDMDQAFEDRKKINAVGDVKISFNDMVIKASAMALKKHSAINASWLGDAIRYHNTVNIGVAVAVSEGLLVPVIKNTDLKGISTIGAEVKELAGKAKDKKLQPQEMEGNTFTISNLGMFGIEEFTAIVNPPDSCILAVGAIKDVPVVKNGAVVPGKRMKVTLSCDHRIVDGASGAAFLQTFKNYLENPISMLV